MQKFDLELKLRKSLTMCSLSVEVSVVVALTFKELGE